MQRPAGTQMQYLRALIESRPMLTRVPDQWLIVNDPLSTTDRIQACRSSDGSYIFIYTSTGKPVRVRLRDKIHDKLSGKTYKAWWYNPPQGTSTLIGQFPRTEPGDRPADVRRGDISREFTPPSNGPETTRFWCWMTPTRASLHRAPRFTHRNLGSFQPPAGADGGFPAA